MKNLETAITKGWADCSPILVAADADDQSTAKKNPAIIKLNLVAEFFFNEVYCLVDAN